MKNKVDILPIRRRAEEVFEPAAVEQQKVHRKPGDPKHRLKGRSAGKSAGKNTTNSRRKTDAGSVRLSK
jgi:hypothetical protein